MVRSTTACRQAINVTPVPFMQLAIATESANTILIFYNNNNNDNNDINVLLLPLAMYSIIRMLNRIRKRVNTINNKVIAKIMMRKNINMKVEIIAILLIILMIITI